MQSFARLAVLFALVSTLGLVSCAGSESADQNPTSAELSPEAPQRSVASPEMTIPDSPAGEILSWAIDALSGRTTEDFSDRFANEFLAELPPTLPEPRLVNALVAAHQSLFAEDEAELMGFESQSDGTELTARVKAVKNQAEYDLYVAVDPETELGTGLLILPARKVSWAPKDWPSIDAMLRELPGELSVLVAEVDGRGRVTPVYQIDPDNRLAIGSAFKLWILGALAELVENGGATWNEPLALDPELKTMPIGALATEAYNKGLEPTASFPLSRYANEMISISDNPATDHLLERVGRDRVIAFMSRVHGKPELNQPFLSTGQMFKLKRGAPEEVMKAYVDAESPAQRQAILDSAAYRNAVISIPMAIRWQQDGPIAIDRIEWFASANDLAKTMIELRRMEARRGMEPLAHALRINDGIHLDDERWPSVSYKGGSEPGVLNLTFLADDAAGQTWFVSLGWNNTEAVLDEDRLIRLAQSIFDRLAAGEMPE